MPLKPETVFQRELILDIEDLFPGVMVLRNDPNHLQGVPDILVLYKHHWAALECKRDAAASVRPNQSYYVKKMNDMSFARFVHPGNKEEVLDELSAAFRD